LADNARPVVVKLATFAPQESSSSSVAEIPASEQRSLPTEEAPSETPAEIAAETLAGSDLESDVDRLRTGPLEAPANQPDEPHRKSTDIDEVMLLPWHGPFQWNGLIVGVVPEGITVDALDPYREPLARLTDRLAVALEFEIGDA